MRKIILHICVLCAAIPCLTSCLIDKVRSYTFQYEVQATLQNEEDWKTLEAYLTESFIGTKTYPIYATYSDAYTQGLEYYNQDIKTIDENLILDCINDPEDIIYVYGVISGDKVREAITYTYWNYAYKQSVRPDPAE